MAPAYLLALIVFATLGIALFTFAINYTSKPLTALSVTLSAFLFCLCTIFLTTDTIESETSKIHLEYGWPLKFVEANLSHMDPPIGYKMRLSGEPTLTWRPVKMLANIAVYFCALSAVLYPIKRTTYQSRNSESKDKQITKIALSVLFLFCIVPGCLFGISHLVHESDKYYCKIANGGQSYERYNYNSNTIPDKSICKSSLLAYQTWVAFFRLLFAVPLVIISIILEMLGLKERLFL